MQFVGTEISDVARVVFVVLASLEIVVGVLGNLLLLCVLFIGRLLDRRHHYNLFIANLAVADLVSLGYFMSFFVLDLIIGYHPVANHAHCVANAYVACLCVIVSLLSLVSISFNRYLHVCHSRLYCRVFDRRKTVLCCVLLWITAAVLTLPTLFGLGNFHYKKTTHICTFSRHPYTSAVSTTVPIGSALAIGYCNFAIFRFWRSAKRRLSSGLLNRSPAMQHMIASQVTEAHSYRTRRVRIQGNKDVQEPNSKESAENNDYNELASVTESHGPPDESKASISSEVLETSANTADSLDDRCSDSVTSYKEPCRTESINDRSAEQRNFIAQRNEPCACGPTEDNFSRASEEKSNLFDPRLRQEGATVAKGCSLPADTSLSCMTGSIAKPSSLDASFKRDWQGETSVSVTTSHPETQVDAAALAGHMPGKSCRIGLVPRMTASSAPPTKRCARQSSRHRSQTYQREFARRRRTRQARERAFVRCLLVVSLLMLLCFLPYGISRIVEASRTVSAEVGISIYLLLFFNNSVNWIVYGVMNRSFRREYAKLIKRFMCTGCRNICKK